MSDIKLKCVKKALVIMTIVFSSFNFLQFGYLMLVKRQFPTGGSRILWYVLLVSSAVFAILKAGRQILSLTEKAAANSYILYLSILGATIIPRTVWLLLVKTVPKSDFRTYHMVAEALSEGKIALADYISVFPHVIGYPYILSFFYRIFGSSPVVAQVLNVLAGCGITFMLYHIGKIYAGRAGGFIAAVIWALWPSQIFYSVLVVTETLYTFLLLVFVYVFIKVTSVERGLFYYLITFALLGMAFSVCNAIRPFGPVLIAACIIWLFLVQGGQGGMVKAGRTVKLLASVFLIAGYFLTAMFINHSISNRLDKEIANRPIGFNLYVGANINSGGTWNEQDAEEFGQLLRNGNYSPQEIHNVLFDRAINRFRSNGAGNAGLILSKFANMWNEDTDSIKYIKSAIDVEASSLDFIKYFNLLDKLSNLYYHVFIVLSIFGCMVLYRNGFFDSIYLLILILWGIIGVHFLVEVAGRYHYTAIPFICLLACLSFQKSARKVVGQEESSSG